MAFSCLFLTNYTNKFYTIVIFWNDLIMCYCKYNNYCLRYLWIYKQFSLIINSYKLYRHIFRIINFRKLAILKFLKNILFYYKLILFFLLLFRFFCNGKFWFFKFFFNLAIYSHLTDKNKYWFVFNTQILASFWSYSFNMMAILWNGC